MYRNSVWFIVSFVRKVFVEVNCVDLVVFTCGAKFILNQEGFCCTSLNRLRTLYLIDDQSITN